MRKIGLIGLLVLTVAGCAKGGEAGKSPADRQAAAQRRETRAAVEQLRESVTEMRRSPALQQRDLVAAVRQTADTLRTLPESEAVSERIANIETYASQIDQSEPRARQQAGWARGALMEGAATLEEIANARGRRDLRPWISAIRARADAIDPDASILEQHDAIVEAFNDLTEATAYLGAQQPRGREPQG